MARRAEEKRSSQEEIDSCWEEIEEDRKIRELWNTYYRLMSPERADRLLDLDGFPKPPSRERRMPE